MQRVFVLDKNKNPLAPCTLARASILLSKKQAVVFRTYPFTIKLKNRNNGVTMMNYKNIAILSMILSTSCFANEFELESLDFLQDKNKSKEVVDKETIKIDTNNFKIDLAQLSEELSVVKTKEINKLDTLSHNDEKIDFLRKIVKNIDPTFAKAKIKKMTELNDFYEIEYKNKIIYIHESGNYILPVVAKVTGNTYEDIQKSKKKEKIAKDLSEFPKSSLISYMSSNATNDIYVFSDYTCPFCKKLHKNILDINNMGINVHYIPFPRNGIRDVKAMNGLKNIICSDNPRLEFNKAFLDSKHYHEKISPLSFNCQAGKDTLHNSMILSDKVEVKGTPYIFLSNGTFLGGWYGVKNFNSLLSKELNIKK